jgi:hypothetical protein
MGKPIGSSEGAERSLVIPNRRKPERKSAFLGSDTQTASNTADQF